MPKRTDLDFIRAVSRRCREIRLLRGYPQEYIQENTKINIGRLESGMRNVSIVTIKLFCDYCGVSVSEFFNGIDDK